MIKHKVACIGIFLGLMLIASSTWFVNARGETTSIQPSQSISPVEDVISNDTRRDNERDVSGTRTGNETEIRSILKNGETKNEIRIHIGAESEGIFIAFEYQAVSNTSEVQLSFELRFRRIIEYIDENSNGVFDPASDIIKQSYWINDFIMPTLRTIVMNNVTVQAVNITTKDHVFSSQAYIPETFVVVNGTIVTPAELKFDIVIHAFPFVNASSNLALYTRLTSESSFERRNTSEDMSNGFADNEEEVRTTIGNETGFFSWGKTCMVDGVEKPVNITTISADDDDSAEQKIFLCYPHGITIIHDPKVGVASILQLPATTTDLTWVYVLVGVVIAAAAVIIVSVVVIKRRRRSTS